MKNWHNCEHQIKSISQMLLRSTVQTEEALLEET